MHCWYARSVCVMALGADIGLGSRRKDNAAPAQRRRRRPLGEPPASSSLPTLTGKSSPRQAEMPFGASPTPRSDRDSANVVQIPTYRYAMTAISCVLGVDVTGFYPSIRESEPA